MTGYDQSWCDALAERAASGAADDVDLVMLYVITDTEDGKVAFNLEVADGKPVHITAGRMPRGQKADITVTIKEPVLRAIWSQERTRDEAFMAGDIKVEGAYQRWLDELVPLFAAEAWQSAWSVA